MAKTSLQRILQSVQSLSVEPGRISSSLFYSLIQEIFVDQTPTGIESLHDIMNIDNNVVLYYQTC